jgi:type IV pilus assembly protein PilA
MSVPQPPPPKSSGLWIIFAIVGGVACLGLGIVGLLAAIAIPNFLQFSCKAKQSEAKTSLSGLFTAEKAFYGEYGFYSSDLSSVSWGPYDKPHYVYGFANAGPGDLTSEERSHFPDYDESRKDTAMAVVRKALMLPEIDAHDEHGAPLDGSSLPSSTGVERDHFLAGAAGNVDRDATLDLWTIDERKTMTNTGNDCAN